MTDNNNQSRASRAARRKQIQAKKKPLWRRILFITGIIALSLFIAGGGVFAYYIITAPPLDTEKLSDPFASQLYNMDGEIIGDLGDVKRTKIEFDDLPQVLIDAVTATEDVRFFQHSGIDYRRLAGAVKANITRGFGAEGASTITHQVVEHAFLSPEKKIKLKVQEQWLALRLERKYSKEQILEMYLNKIFYGSNAYGVASAAKIYFGKTDLHDLTLVEAAILAGLPQRPTAYNPYENPDLMKKRVETVLDLMTRHGKISEEEATEAKQTDISSLLAGKRPSAPPYEAFIQKVEKEIHEKLDGTDIYTDGLKIYTTLDNKVQEHVEFLLTDSSENPIQYPDNDLQAGMTVVDTKTGAIRAIGGSRNNKNIGGFNYAFNETGRQPGSTFKPILSFAPAIEYNKISTYHQLNDDKPYKIGNIEYRNHNRRYQGWMSARYALANSLNVPTLKTLEETGIDKAQSFSEGLGISFHEDKMLIGDAIGGASTNTTPVELAGAYSAFGNEGIFNEPYSVVKVEFPNGQVVDLKSEPKAAMADYTAYMITDMLKSVVTEGTGKNANIPGMPVAGKTGTTNLEGKRGANNSWFAGYTTNYTIAVWTGYDDHSKIIENTQIPHALFKNTMTEISKGVQTPDFVKPNSVVELNIVKGSNPAALAGKTTSSANTVTELFVKGTEPTTTSSEVDVLDPVSNLNAVYNDESNAIQVSWDYDEDLDVSFHVSVRKDDGQTQDLSTTAEHALEISNVENGTYTIQVVVISNEDEGIKSDPAVAEVKVGEDEEVPSVSDLHAAFDSTRNIIGVSWSYDGPTASFEVDVNGQKQTVNSNGIEISGAQNGSYTITVTPITQDGTRGESRSTSVTVNTQGNEPNEQQPDTDPSTPPGNRDENEGNDNSNDHTGGNGGTGDQQEE